MRIKSFRAETAREALALVRQEMGEDAVILHSREVRSGGVLGIGVRQMVEVTAALDEPAAVRPTSAAQKPTQESRQPTPMHGQDALAAIHDLRAEIQEIKCLVRTRDEVAEVSDVLMANSGGLKADLLGLSSQDLASAERPHLVDIISDALAQYIAAPADSDKSIIALVGPTGVGKTTTLAKLAAHSALREQRPTALITCDTFRIGAVEQIRVYARILGVPLEVVATPEDMQKAVNAHSDKDVILIDTIGRNHRNAMQLRELQALLAPAAPTEVHLVLSAAASAETQEEAARSFQALSPNRLVISKVDETEHLGCIVNLPLSTGLPVSCVTTGQNVPDDIRIAEPRALAELALGVAA